MTRLRDLARDESELEMTPMIDVTFLLLIFFMCTLKFKTLEGKLAAFLPNDVGRNSPTTPFERVEVRLRLVEPGTKLVPSGERPYSSTDRGRYQWGDDRVLAYSVGPYETRDLAALELRLSVMHRDLSRAGLAQGETPKASIDAGPQTTYEDVVRVLDRALDAGFVDVSFVGQAPERGR